MWLTEDKDGLILGIKDEKEVRSDWKMFVRKHKVSLGPDEFVFLWRQVNGNTVMQLGNHTRNLSWGLSWRFYLFVKSVCVCVKEVIMK